MGVKTILSVLLCSLIAGRLFAGGPPTNSVTTNEITQGILARSEAVFSGQLDYQQEQAFPGKKTETREFRVIFSGASWRLDSKILASEMDVVVMPSAKDKMPSSTLQGYLELVSLSHHGKSVEYQSNPQFDGSVHKSAAIGSEKAINNTMPFRPVFAGSFWFASTKNFVQENVNKAVRKGVTEVNGVKAEVLEWKVSASENFKAFHVVNELTDKGGTLRVFASPQLGYVLPRVQFVGQEEKVQALFDCSDFVECTDGIFFPKSVVLQYYNAKGPGLRIAYQIREVTKINQSISDNDFVLQLPIGTNVYDERSGKESIFFEIKEDGGIPQDLEDVIAVESPLFWGRNWPTAVILGGAAALVLVVLCLGFRKYTSRARKT